jgi:uncharacterized protein with FMN-binding domain
MKKADSLFFLTLLTLVVFLSLARAAEDGLADGVYEGEHSFIKVRVTVENNSISDIEILHHGGGGQKYAEMVRPMAHEMIQRQSVDIDDVTGATVSSNNLKMAVSDALQKAASK